MRLCLPARASQASAAVRLLVHLRDGLARIGGKLQMRIAADDLLESFPRFVVLLQIILVDLADGEQGVEAILAAGIFAAEKLVLRDGGTQRLLIVEGAPAFGEQLGHGHDAGVGLAAGGRRVVDAAIGVDDALVFAAGTLAAAASVELLAHSLGVFKLRAGLLLPGLNTGGKGGRQQAGTARKTPSARVSIRARRFVPSLTASSFDIAQAEPKVSPCC